MSTLVAVVIAQPSAKETIVKNSTVPGIAARWRASTLSGIRSSLL
jgi:hypothetical protein